MRKRPVNKARSMKIVDAETMTERTVYLFSVVVLMRDGSEHIVTVYALARETAMEAANSLFGARGAFLRPIKVL